MRARSHVYSSCSLLPPGHRERQRIVGHPAAGLDDGVHVEERAVGVEDVPWITAGRSLAGAADADRPATTGRALLFWCHQPGLHETVVQQPLGVEE